MMLGAMGHSLTREFRQYPFTLEIIVYTLVPMTFFFSRADTHNKVNPITFGAFGKII